MQYLKFGRKGVGLLLAVLLIVLVLGGLWVTNALGWRGFRLMDVEAFIGAQLPAQAENPQFVTEDEKSRIVWLRFTLPPAADLSPFLEAMGIREALREGFTPFPSPNYQEGGIEWWAPHAAQSYTGLHAIHDDKVYEILIDGTDANQQLVYLRVYALQ